MTQARPALTPQDFDARMAELRSLESGWFDGTGCIIPPEGIDWLAGVVRANTARGLPLPYAYPSPDGSVWMEWDVGSRTVSLKVDTASKWGEWFNPDDRESAELDLGDDNAWAWVASQLVR